MAEHLLTLKARGLGWEARSAGIAAERYFARPPGVTRALAAKGVQDAPHRPTLVTRDALRWADEILCMAREHRDWISEEYPEFRAKTQLFLEAAGLGERDVKDPLGRSDEVYEACCDEIERGVAALIRRRGSVLD